MKDIHNFKSIETLFAFRNNIAHGKTYTERALKQNDTDDKSINFSPDSKYERVRQYLIDFKVIDYQSITANKPEILNVNVPFFFYVEVKSFLFSVINAIEFNKKENIKMELENSYVDCI